MKLTKDILLSRGWTEKDGYMYLPGSPRMGWWDSGRLVVGWFDYPQKVTSIEQLKKIIDDMKKEQQILRFIEGLQNEGTKDVFLNGYCYWLALILQVYADDLGLFHDLLYHPIKNHFAVRIGERAYDITGMIDDIGYERWSEFSRKDKDSAMRIWECCVTKTK